MGEQKLNLKEEIRKVLRENGLEVSKKGVRRLLEKNLDMEEGDLEDMKDRINKHLEAVVAEIQKEKPDVVSGDSDSNSEGSASEAESPQAKTKGTKRKADAAANAPTPKKHRPATVITPSGETAPKGIKNSQCRTFTGEEFERVAEDMEFELWGNKIIGPPRSFTSNNRGWYAGGKIQVPVGGKMVWAQIGVNLTIMGSKDWKAK